MMNEEDHAERKRIEWVEVVSKLGEAYERSLRYVRDKINEQMKVDIIHDSEGDPNVINGVNSFVRLEIFTTNVKVDLEDVDPVPVEVDGWHIVEDESGKYTLGWIAKKIDQEAEIGNYEISERDN